MTKVKICGLMSMEDVFKVNRCVPDYAGFVFAPESRRRVTAEEAARMKRRLDSRIQAVGVFVNEEIPVIANLVKTGVIDLVQLHGEEGEGYLLELKSLVSCPVIRSVAIAHQTPQACPSGADYLLFDTASKERGGTGKRFDWSLIPKTKTLFFLAGGLSEENVAEAIGVAAPYCVDVSSGIEEEGRKDENKMDRFVRLVRQER